MLSWLFSWLWDNLTDALMVLFVFCQVWLLYQQSRLSKLLAARSLHVTPKKLKEMMKMKSPKRPKPVKDREPVEPPELCRRCKYRHYCLTHEIYEEDSEDAWR